MVDLADALRGLPGDEYLFMRVVGVDRCGDAVFLLVGQVLC